MHAVDKAVWYIERHYNRTIKLDDLATVCGVSRYHLSRVFAFITGIPISRYLRRRRLSQAAIALADGKKDILDLALSLGYGSHEAFTRAFKSNFGLTPQRIRAQGHTDNVNLQASLIADSNKSFNLPQPRIVKSNALRLSGLTRKYTSATSLSIPNQWAQFSQLTSHIDCVNADDTFGVIYSIDDQNNFEYLCAVEVLRLGAPQKNLTHLYLPEQYYAVFQHHRHVTQTKATCLSIWQDWLPDSGYKPANAPFIERYSNSFNSTTGDGGLEIWLPIHNTF